MSYGPYSVASWLDDYCAEILGNLGLVADAWRMEFLEVWSHFETAGGQAGTGLYFNILGTTYPGPGHSPNVGGQENVWHFDSIAHGAYATAMTINAYPSIMATLINETVQPGTAQAIRATWGTGGFADLLDSGWHPSGVGATVSTGQPPAAPPAPVVPAELPPGPYPSVDLPPGPDGMLNIPNASLVPGQLNVVRMSYGGTVPAPQPGFWTFWDWQNGAWQQWAPGDVIPPGRVVGLLPPGLSLPGGLQPRHQPQVAEPPPPAPVGTVGRSVGPLVGQPVGMPVGPGGTTGTDLTGVSIAGAVLPGPAGGIIDRPNSIEGAWNNWQDWNNAQIPAKVTLLPRILQDMEASLI